MNIVVTGAGSGIGAAITKRLSEDGHRLFVCGRRYQAIQKVCEDAKNASAWMSCDVSDEMEVNNFFWFVRRSTSSLDAVIHCAGDVGEIGSVKATDAESWLETIKNNLFGAYLMAKYSIPLLEKGRDPILISFSGGGAFEPFPNFSAYACAKAAIVRLNECLDVELREKGIRVVTVAPGPVATNIHQATLDAGEAKAGKSQYEKVKSILAKNDEGAMKRVVECVRFILSCRGFALSGKTIAAQFDPWDSLSFEGLLNSRHDIYTLRRINPTETKRP